MNQRIKIGPRNAVGMRIALLVACAISVFAAFTPARATLSYGYAGSAKASASTDSVPVSATATFSLSSGQILLTLTNTTPKTMSTNEMLTGIDFTLLINNKAVSFTLKSVTAVAMNVNSSGVPSYPNGKTKSVTVTNSWEGTSSGIDFKPYSTYGILGPPGSNGDYTYPSPTIDGNKTNNPFAAGSATFTLSCSSITSTVLANPSSISLKGVSFLFNAGCDYSCPGSSVSPVPEIGGGIVFGLGLALACAASVFWAPASRRMKLVAGQFFQPLAPAGNP